MSGNGTEPPQPPSVEVFDLGRAAMDVAESCADALLAASAQVLLMRGVAPDVDTTLGVAVAALEEIVQRTIREGGRAR